MLQRQQVYRGKGAGIADEYEGALQNVSEAEQEQMVETGFWEKVRIYGSYVPFVRDAVAAYHCMLDEKVAMTTRAAIVMPLAYFVLPADVVPDLILGLGFADDAAVFAGAMRLFGGGMTDRHYEAADLALGGTARG